MGDRWAARGFAAFIAGAAAWFGFIAADMAAGEFEGRTGVVVARSHHLGFFEWYSVVVRVDGRAVGLRVTADQWAALEPGSGVTVRRYRGGLTGLADGWAIPPDAKGGG